MKCPKCEKEISVVKMAKVAIDPHVAFGYSPYTYEQFKNSWWGAAYSCGDCGALLSVGPDPLSLKQDIVESLLKALKEDSSEE